MYIYDDISEREIFQTKVVEKVTTRFVIRDCFPKTVQFMR